VNNMPSTKKRKSSSSKRRKADTASPEGIRKRSLKRWARAAFDRLSTSPFLLSLPLSLLFLSQLTDFLVLLKVTDASSLLIFSAQPVQSDDPRRIEAEGLQKTFQAILYLYLLVMCAFNWRAVFGYFRQWPHLVLIVGMLLFTATYSTEPTKVITNSILILISILIPLAFAIGHKDYPDRVVRFYLYLLVPFIVSHSASLLLLFYYGMSPFEIITSTNRYGGLAGNPNTLGNTAVIGLWACFAIILSQQTGKLLRAFAIVSVLVFANSIAMSGSGTALAVSLVVVALLFWMRFVSAFSAQVRGAVNVFATAIFLCGVLAVLVMVTPAQIFLVFTESMGKDATLTGRTELWDMAKGAIAQRPWLGWSFDSHASVKAEREFFIDHNHYHNGFLDTLVEGGAVLLALVLYHLAHFARVFIKAFHRNRTLFTLVVPGIMLVILNISEYSLLRPLSEIWQLYIACFVLLTFRTVATSNQSSTRRTKSSRKRSKRVLRWA